MTTTPRSPRLLLLSTVMLAVAGIALLGVPNGQKPDFLAEGMKSIVVMTKHLLTGCLYGGVGMLALSALRLREDGFWWAFAALVITWLNDTMAYFAGRFLGRRKLYPAVSPNKTWEGFLGGLLGSVVGLFILRAVAFPVLTVVDCLVLGVLGGLLGPMGDLCESMLKRAYGVKDSSRLVPGHGGMLDRIDALLFNAPLVFLYVTFVRGLLN